MPSGTLGTAALAANTNTTVYTVPEGKVSSLSVALCNRGEKNARAYIAVAALESPTPAEWLEYNVSIPANGILERTAIVCGEGENIVVRVDSADVAVRVQGFEEEA